MTKKILRKNMLEKRALASTINTYLLVDTAKKLLPDSGTVAFFYPIKNEIDLRKVWEEAWDRGLTVVFPRVEDKSTMVFCKVSTYSDLKAGMWGILEPITTPYYEDIDLAFVPALCLGEDGARLGYGAGYYDRYFADKNSYLVGVCAEEFLCNTIPTEDHDLFMNCVLTEKRLIRHN